jgi:hypothetical protein
VNQLDLASTFVVLQPDHSAVPTKMLFITPGEGTQNKAIA